MKDNGRATELRNTPARLNPISPHYTNIHASEREINGKRIKRSLRSESRDYLEELDVQNGDEQIYCTNGQQIKSDYLSQPELKEGNHYNDEEMKESQQLFYEDNGQSEDQPSNTMFDNKQEIDRILCSTKYDSQTKFKLLQGIIRRTTGEEKRPQTGTTRDKKSLYLRKKLQRPRIQTSYKNRVLMDDYDMGIQVQEQSIATKMPTFMKVQRPTTSQTVNSFNTVEKIGRLAGNARDISINMNTEKPLALRKKYYEEINTTDTSQRKRYLPSDFHRKSLEASGEFTQITEEPQTNIRKSRSRAQTAKQVNISNHQKHDSMVKHHPFSGNISQALRRQGIERGHAPISENSWKLGQSDGFNQTAFNSNQNNVQFNLRSRQNNELQNFQTPYTDIVVQNQSSYTGHNPSRVAQILSNIAFDKQPKTEKISKKQFSSQRSIDIDNSQASEVGAKVYQKFVKIRKVFKRATVTARKVQSHGGVRSQASITDDLKAQRLYEMQQKLQEKFGDKLLFEEDLRDKCAANSIGSIRSASHSSHSKNRSSSHHRSRGSRSRSLSKRLSHFARSTTLIQKLTQHQNMPVSNETMLLINASEVLAKDGIHGKIARIGLGFGTGRHTANRHSSVPPERMKSAKARSISPPLRHDRAISAHSYHSPIQMSIGLSPRTRQSVREKQEQVTQGRFEPDQFNAQCQTGGELLKNYLQKPTRVTETETDPVIIVPKKNTSTFMVQTDPVVDEILHMMEPYSLSLPREYPSNIEYERVPGIQTKATVDLPQPLEDDKRDWSESALYLCVKNLTMATFLKKGLIQATDGKPIRTTETLVQNLNPLQLPMLSSSEVDYILDKIRGETKQQEYKITIQELEKWFSAAKITIEVLVANLVNPEVVNYIFFAYYQAVTQGNVIKLLIRARKLYQARQMATSILNFAAEIELLHEPRSTLYNLLMNSSTEEELTDTEQIVLQQVTKTIDRALAITDTFVSDNVISKKGFVFLKEDFKESLVRKSQILLGYWLLRTKLNKQSDEALIQLYHAWHQNALQVTGQPQKPTEEMLKRITFLQKKGSRVMRVIAEIPPTPEEYKSPKTLYLRPHVFIEEPPAQEPQKQLDELLDALDSCDQDPIQHPVSNRVPILKLDSQMIARSGKIYATASENEMKQILLQNNAKQTEFTIPQSVKSNIQSQFNGSVTSY